MVTISYNVCAECGFEYKKYRQGNPVKEKFCSYTCAMKFSERRENW